MASLSALQLIYSRVETNYSPKRLSGFQVVFQSAALTPPEASAIERRVQCFVAGPSGDRIQFFTLETGRVVIAYSIAIQADGRINDKDRRSGIFIAHALIFDPREFFAYADNNPFRVLDAERAIGIFLDDAAGLEEEFTNPKQVITLPMPPQPRFPVQPPANWSATELEKLSAWMETRPSDQSLMFVGNSSQIEELMQMIHHFALPQERIGLTFDTWVDGSQPTAGAYWAVGGSKRFVNSKIITVDLANPRLPDIPITAPKAVGYGSWLKHSLKESATKTIEMIPTAQFLAMVQATNQWVTPSFELSAVAADHVARFQWDEIQPRLISAFSPYMTPATAKRLSLALPRYGWNGFVLFQIAYTQQVPTEKLAFDTYRWIVDEGITDLAKDADYLIELANQAKYLPLCIVGLIFVKKGLFNRGNDASQQLPDFLDFSVREGIFPTLLANLCPKVTTPDRLVTSQTAQMIIQHIISTRYDEAVLAHTLEALLDSGAGRYLGGATSLVNLLAPKSLQKIQQKFKTSTPDPQFAHAVEMRLRQS